MAYNTYKYRSSVSYRALCLIGKTVHLLIKAITVLGILSILLILITKFHEVDFSSWKAWLHTSDPILIPLIIAFALKAIWKIYHVLEDWYIRAYDALGTIGVILLTVFLPVAAALALAAGILSIVFPILGGLMEPDDDYNDYCERKASYWMWYDEYVAKNK